MHKRIIRKKIVEILPTRYHYIIDQLNKDFLISFKANDLNFKDWYSVQLNAKFEKKYSRPRLGYFQLQNIYIYNKKSGKKEKIIISFLEGMFIGFFMQDIEFDNYILNEYDTSNLKEKHFKNENDKEALMEIIKGVNKAKLSDLEIDDTFKIELPEGVFYPIKNLQDGNYLAVNNIGEVYELLHDPYRLIKKASSIAELS